MPGFETHYKELFLEAVDDLKSEIPLQSKLLPTVMKKKGKGKIAHHDHDGPADGMKAKLFDTAQSWLPATDKRTIQRQTKLVADDAATYNTLEEWLKTRTPHEEINRQRTLFFYRLLDWGYSFDHTTDVLEFTSPRSRVLRQGYRKIQAGIDALIILAIKAANVSRVTTGHDVTSNVALPASQQINSFANDEFSLNDITAVMERFDDVNCDARRFILISPKNKKRLIDKDANKINNQDFVDSYSFFREGTLPDIYGAHVIAHPFINDNEFLAYSEDAICFMNFGEEFNRIGESPDERFQAKAYMEKGADAKRVDDLGVVIGTITSA